MTDNIIDKADSLMRRHRAFVAGEAMPADSPTAVPPAPTFSAASTEAEAEDIPLLTEVVADDAGAMGLPPLAGGTDIEVLLRERLAAALPRQREVLRHELALWLDEQLPQIVMRVLDGVTDQLVAQINTQARMALLPKLQAALEADNSGLSTED
ncbi:MAG: hypothetical protein Q8O25_02515 [Sulfurisoma sp.]|nr:hypothetical protein [Sulfurisoma sp.]